MKRMISMLAGLSVMATASMAFAYPGQPGFAFGPMQRAKQDASTIAAQAQLLINQARFGWHRRGPVMGIQGLKGLKKAALDLASHASVRKLGFQVQSIQSWFAQAQAQGAFRFGQASFNLISSNVSDLGLLAQQIPAYRIPTPVMVPAPQYPVPPPAPPVTVQPTSYQPTTYYQGGATITVHPGY